MSEELKRCPFCDGPAGILMEARDKFKIVPYYNYIAGCRICGANIHSENFENEAIAAWNRRV